MLYNETSRKDYDKKIKGNLIVQELNRYIDNCLIDEYATPTHDGGYYLDLDDLPEYEKNNFLEIAMKHDTSLRDEILFQMQKLINQRLNIYEEDLSTIQRFSYDQN